MKTPTEKALNEAVELCGEFKELISGHDAEVTHNALRMVQAIVCAANASSLTEALETATDIAKALPETVTMVWEQQIASGNLLDRPRRRKAAGASLGHDLAF